MRNIQIKLHYYSNLIGLYIVCFILASALYFQFSLSESPCPLCLLQRACFMAIGICLACNLRYGIKVSTYGAMLFSALLGLAISTRQILLHIIPNSGSYGDPIFGIHMYTWAAITFITIIIMIGFALMMDKRIKEETVKPGKITLFAFNILLLIILTNVFFSYF